jgi:hypothetical protein
MFSYLALEERIVDGVRACRAKLNMERDILHIRIERFYTVWKTDSSLRRFVWQ